MLSEDTCLLINKGNPSAFCIESAVSQDQLDGSWFLDVAAQAPSSQGVVSCPPLAARARSLHALRKYQKMTKGKCEYQNLTYNISDFS